MPAEFDPTSEERPSGDLIPGRAGGDSDRDGESLTPPRRERVQELVDELTARSEARPDSCLELSEISEMVQDADLDEDDAQALQDLLEARGVEFRDDCGRDVAE